MNKLEVRKSFFKLKNKGFSYTQCRRILKSKYGFEASTRTLKRWIKRLDEGNWDLIDKSRRPKQILTDNGGTYGLNSKHSKFDVWCRRRGIGHIRTKIHSPTTNGKVERLFKTIDEELKFCDGDIELFRFRYNHFRPHSSLKGKKPCEIYHDFAILF